MKTLGLILVVMLSMVAFTQTPEVGYELTCRAKAKEVAAETYKNCVSENRTAQLEQVRKDYQQKLKLLKEDYEKEIQKLSTKKPESTNTLKQTPSVGTPVTTKTQPAPKVIAKNTRGLPAKKITEKSPDDMTMQLKPVTTAPMTDDSVMDLPEPIPVENMPSESSL